MVNPENPRKSLRKDGHGVADDGYHIFEGEDDGHGAQWHYLKLTATVSE
jgi:hypothetical protein